MIVTINGIPVYDAIINEQDGLVRISLVDDPAVHSDFQAFSQEQGRELQMYAVENEDRRLVRGCIIRADYPIIRKDREGNKFYLIFKAEEIRKMAEKYLLEGRQNDVNLMHQGAEVEGVNMVQYFIKGDGIQVEGFDNVADGSLFGEFHITNDEIWEQVKAGTYKGFSLEGFFTYQPEQSVDEVQDIVDSLAESFSKLLNFKDMSKLKKVRAILSRMLEGFGNATTDKGILAWDGDEDLKVGDSVYLEDADGNRTSAEDGDYKTADGKVIVVVDGKVSEIKDAEAEVAPEPEERPEEQFGRKATDKGELLWEGEDDLKAGDPVFVESEGGLTPAPDGDYITEDGKTIRVAEGIVAEILDNEAEVAPEGENEEMAALKAENEALKQANASFQEQIANLQAEMEKLRRTPQGKPAHEEFKSSAEFGKTGNKGLDNLARILTAK